LISSHENRPFEPRPRSGLNRCCSERQRSTISHICKIARTKGTVGNPEPLICSRSWMPPSGRIAGVEALARSRSATRSHRAARDADPGVGGFGRDRMTRFGDRRRSAARELRSGALDGRSDRGGVDHQSRPGEENVCRLEIARSADCTRHFGGGYASIGALREFGFDRIKIDRSLIVAAETGTVRCFRKRWRSRGR
jgi:hypothetical protein